MRPLPPTPPSTPPSKDVDCVAPAGLSFAIAEHLAMRRWAGAHGWALSLSLDKVVGDAVFEETVLLSHPARGWPAHILWRMADAVVVQQKGMAPGLFRTMETALHTLCPRPVRPRRWPKLRYVRAFLSGLSGA